MIKNRFHSSIKKKFSIENKLDTPIKESNQHLSNKSADGSTYASSKSLINVTADQIINLFPDEMQVEDKFNNKMDYSTVTSKECGDSSDLFSQFNYDLPCYERNIKSEDSLYSNSNSFMFNFDDFFAL